MYYYLICSNKQYFSKLSHRFLSFLSESFEVSSIRLNHPCIVTFLLNIKVIRFEELITNES